MKSTAIIRKIDFLGRIVLPKELHITYFAKGRSNLLRFEA